ncbi:MAG: hypothetical protein IPN16_13285 [Gemmatimonadetes bacterium]|nr:hypothetical protein [Gemmatimonadota bacterium]
MTHTHTYIHTPPGTVPLQRRHDALRLSHWPCADIWQHSHRGGAWRLVADARLRVRALLAQLRETEADRRQLDLFAAAPGHASGTNDALRELLEEIPLAVRDAVSRYRLRQHPLLQVAAAHPLGWQLLAEQRRGGNPGLAFALADCVGQEPDPAVRRELAALVCRRRAEIARRVGFLRAGTAVRVLACVAPAHASRALLRDVQFALTNRAARALLCQVRRVSPVVMAVVRSVTLRELVTPTFVDDMADYPASGTAAMLDCIRYFRDEMHRQRYRVRALESADQLWDVLDRLEGDPHTMRHPPPPLQLPDGALLRYVPLTSYRALEEEGRVMRHCATTYVRQVVQMRRCYLYRIEGAVRATLRLEKVGGRWRVAEVRGEGNGAVSAELCAVVREVVRGVQGGVGG